uniref:Ovule protein n=1 Tax=Steinernema glaseri TaxID=37863 RepID=A0A1I7YEE3_9BILA
MQFSRDTQQSNINKALTTYSRILKVRTLVTSKAGPTWKRLWKSNFCRYLPKAIRHKKSPSTHRLQPSMLYNWKVTFPVVAVQLYNINANEFHKIFTG